MACALLPYAGMRILEEGNVFLVAYLVFTAATVTVSDGLAAAMPIPRDDSAPPIMPASSAEDETRTTASPQTSTAVMAESVPSESCLASTICEVKERLRWRTPSWSPSFCRVIARAVLRAAERHNLSPALILAVMINESDLNENAISTTLKDGRVYAKDGGLMGIRCVLDKKERCSNPNPYGQPWQQVMAPANNIALGARELAHWRDGGGVEKLEKLWRDREGVVQRRERLVRCRHKDHAYWAHYNHGERYLDHGRARHYPHRVAVLYYALAEAMKLDTTPLMSAVVTMRDKGQRVRTADRPAEARHRKLCRAIRESAARCDAIVTAKAE